MQDHTESVAATGSGTELLDSAVAHVVRETGASVAMLYLQSERDGTLHLTVLVGVPGQLAAPGPGCRCRLRSRWPTPYACGA